MPLSVRVGLTIVLVALAVAVSVTVRRGARGGLRRQGLVGVRTPSAMVDDAAFDRANRAAAPLLQLVAALALLVAVAVAVGGGRSVGGPGGVIVGGVLLGGLVLAAGLRGERAARRDLDPVGQAVPSVSTSHPGDGGGGRDDRRDSQDRSAGTPREGRLPPAGRTADPSDGRRGAPGRPTRARSVSGRGGGRRPPSR